MTFLASLPWVQAASNKVGLRELPAYLDTIVFFFLLFQFTYSFLGEYLTRLLIPKKWDTFPQRVKVDWKIRCVSMIQSTILGPGSLFVVFGNWEARQQKGLVERLFTTNDAELQLATVAFAYMLWHLLAMVYHYKQYGPGMFVHGLIGSTSALAVFVCSPNCPFTVAWPDC